MSVRITLNQFVAMLPAMVEAFAATTRDMHKAGEEGFVGDEFENREFHDWCAELGAYDQFCDLSEELSQAEGRSR